jgi:hypothetical protein
MARAWKGVSLILVLMTVVGCQRSHMNIEHTLAQLRNTSISDLEAECHLFALREWLKQPANSLAAIGLDDRSIADLVFPYLQRKNAGVRSYALSVFSRVRDKRVCPFLRAELSSSATPLDDALKCALRSNGEREELVAILEKIRSRGDPNGELIYTLYIIGRREILPGIRALKDVRGFVTLSDNERNEATRLRGLLEDELEDRIRAGLISTNSLGSLLLPSEMLEDLP